MARSDLTVSLALATLLALGLPLAGKAADYKYDAAEQILREALESGDPVHPKWVELGELVAPGLEKNEAGALYYAAFLYNYGRAGYPVDPAKADSLELAAARLRYIPAMRARAIRADLGYPPGVKRDPTKAAFWFRELAKEGSASAACWLLDALKKSQLDFRPADSELEKWRGLSQSCSSP